MKDTQSQFIRKYKRQSKSIWKDVDDSTVLLLADVEHNQTGITLNYVNYVYLHRDEVGRILGISISKALLDANPDFDSRYLSGIEMYGFLLMYIDEITRFCEHFSDEFEAIFGLDPISYFEAAELRWFTHIRDV